MKQSGLIQSCVCWTGLKRYRACQSANTVNHTQHQATTKNVKPERGQKKKGGLIDRLLI
jgi:hypothetical protein